MSVATSLTGASTRKDRDESEFQRTARRVLDRWGRSNKGRVRLRLARRDDLSALCALNAKAILDLGRDGLFMPMSESFLREMVRDGVILMLEQEGKPLGYSIAAPVGKNQPSFIPGFERGGTGLLFGTALDQILRGQGWHPRLIRIRRRMFVEAGFVSLQSTVSPFNTVSLANLMNAGLHVVGLKILLDGHPRFLLHRELRKPSEPSGNPQRVELAQSGDLSEHAGLLADGFVATELRKDDTYALLYTKGQGRNSEGSDP